MANWTFTPTEDKNPLNFYGYTVASLPQNKRGAFVLEGNNSKRLFDQMADGFEKIGKREFDYYLRYLRKASKSDELPEGITENEDGFGMYLNLLLLETGMYGRLMGCLADEMKMDWDNDLLQTALYSRCKEIIERRVCAVYGVEKFTYRAPKLFQIPNDKSAHNIREGTSLEWEKGIFNVSEKDPKTKKKVVSKVTMDLTALHAMGFTRLDVFDFLVFHACVAIQLEGNEATTLQSIYRAMTGKKSNRSRHISEAILVDIHDSIVKLMSIPVEFNIQGILRAYTPDGKTLPKNPVDTFLPAYTTGKTILQGQEVDSTVIFRDKAPLVKVAEAKGNQFARYDTVLLDVPLQSTRKNMVIAPNLLQKMEDTRYKKSMSPTIIIDDFMKLCEYTGERRRFVQALEKCCAYWKEQKYLKSYEFTALRDNPKTMEKLKFVLVPRPKQKNEEK